MIVETFTCSASHACRFEGCADVDADATLAVIIAAVGGAVMPADDDADAGTRGSAVIEASAAFGVSAGLVQ